LLSLVAGAVAGAIVVGADRATSPARTGVGDGPGFAFLQGTAAGPFRWNPCEPIHYQWNPSQAPAGAVEDLQEVVRRLEDDTGIDFVDDGSTSRTDRQQQRWDYTSPDPDDDSPLPVLVTWVSPEEFRRYANPRVYAGVGIAVPLDEYGVYESGLIVMNADGSLVPGFDGRFSHGPILQHEWGHVLGLAHVGSPSELMWSSEVDGAAEYPDFSVTDWGEGDLRGLQRLGLAAGCL
jgi:hypothetical protein